MKSWWQGADNTRWALPFRVSLATAFILITLPVLILIIGVLYVRNSELARNLARDSMDRASSDIANDIEGLFRPLARVVGATAALGRIDQQAPRRSDWFQYYLEVLKTTPQLEAIYVGFAHDGAFYEAIRLATDTDRFGPSGAQPPKNARFAFQILDASSGEMTDNFTYLTEDGGIIGHESVPVRYDPRKRPWYALAWEKTGPVISDPYVFFSSGRPGLTLSQRIATSQGDPIGAVGANISLELLSGFLARERVGEHGVAFIVDPAGSLISYPRVDIGVRMWGKELTIAKAKEIDDQRVVRAMTIRDSGAGDRFTMSLDDADYLVSFTPLHEGFGKDWSIGVIAAEDDFVGPIRRSSLIMLALGVALTLLSVLAILWVSKSMTRPIAQVVNETKRIREFNLGGGTLIRSRIDEINELGRALGAMEEGLKSFGAYIPKALVRRIVTSGKSTEIGGERRTLTILFTDIKNFTKQTETLDPENVLRQLSSYLDVMSRCVQEHGGTVDKFIGDAIMAIWNAPSDDPDHAVHACRAMLRCHALNAEQNANFVAHGYMPFLTRLGLHTGDVVVGNVGSADRMQYTALGAQVNLASRVEGLNKRYGTQLLVTGAVEELARGRFLFKPIDLVVPAGFSRPVALFEPIGEIGGGPDRAPDRMTDECKEWQIAIDAYRNRNWQAALDLFRGFADRYRSDDLTRLYVARCTGFVAAPPPPEWDGAEHFETK